ncbi:unnamed protein product [Soboliphyme baturini]|uniref:Abdominal-A n=1 Tax=Soboliphyme baturini TaxID=241478 RepID=A0A183IAV6_9BILA|nr:unnamed protein product [Soboliphyme baturini]
MSSFYQPHNPYFPSDLSNGSQEQYNSAVAAASNVGANIASAAGPSVQSFLVGTQPGAASAAAAATDQYKWNHFYYPYGLRTASYDRFGDSSPAANAQAGVLTANNANGTLGTSQVNLNPAANGVDNDATAYHVAAAHSYNASCLATGTGVAPYSHFSGAANPYPNPSHQSTMLFGSPGVTAQSMPTQLMGLGGYPPYAWISRSCKYNYGSTFNVDVAI